MNQEIRNLIKLNRKKATDYYSCSCDREYADFCVRVLELRQFIADHFGKMLLPREIDNLLLELDNSFSIGNKGQLKMGKVIASGIRGQEKMLVECNLTKNGIEFLFNGEQDSRLEETILEEMKEHHPISLCFSYFFPFFLQLCQWRDPIKVLGNIGIVNLTVMLCHLQSGMA